MKKETIKQITRQIRQKNLKCRKGSVANQIAIILLFAGACLITLFLLAWVLLMHGM